LIGRKQE